jgi:hypothetical protein
VNVVVVVVWIVMGMRMGVVEIITSVIQGTILCFGCCNKVVPVLVLVLMLLTVLLMLMLMLVLVLVAQGEDRVLSSQYHQVQPLQD